MLSLFQKSLLLLSLSYCVTTPLIAANSDLVEKNPHQHMITSSCLFDSVQEPSETPQTMSLAHSDDTSSAEESSMVYISSDSDSSYLNSSTSSDGSIESSEQHSKKESNPFTLMLEKALHHTETIKNLRQQVFSIYRIQDLIPELVKTPLLWQHKIPSRILERIRLFSIETQDPNAASLLAIYSNQFLSEGSFRKKAQVLRNILKKASKHSECSYESVFYQVCLAKLNTSLYHRSSKSWKKYKNITSTLDTLITRVIREHKETMDQNIAYFLQREYGHFVGCQPQFYARDYDNLMTGFRYLSMYAVKGHSNDMFSLGVYCMDTNIPLKALTGWNRKIKTLKDRIYWGLGLLQTSLNINPYPSRFSLAKEKAIGLLGEEKAHQLFGRNKGIRSLELDHVQENQSQS